MSQLEPGSPKQETDPGGRRCWWSIDGKAPRGIERGIPWVGWILFAVIVATWNAWPEPMPRLPVIDLENAYPDVANSIREASKATREQPRSGKAWGRLGMILLACGYGTESIVVFAEAGRLDPKDGRWPFLQGIELERSDPERAVACIGRAIAAESDRVLFRLRLAEMLIALGKLDEAQDPLQVARTLEPDNPRTQLAWARWEYRRGHLEQSLAHANRAAELRPDTRAIHQLLARIHHRLNQPAAAARQLEVVQRLPARSIIFPDPITNSACCGVIRVELLTTPSSCWSSNRPNRRSACYRESLTAIPGCSRHRSNCGEPSCRPARSSNPRRPCRRRWDTIPGHRNCCCCVESNCSIPGSGARRSAG